MELKKRSNRYLYKQNTSLKIRALLDNKSAQNRLLPLAFLNVVIAVCVLWIYKNRKIYFKIRYFTQINELTDIIDRYHLPHIWIKML